MSAAEPRGAPMAVFAYSDTGHACLQALLARGARIVLLVTHADDPAEAAWFPSVADLARAHGIEPLILPDLSSPGAVERVRAARPELLFSFYYRQMLPREILAVPKLGAFNMHGSLLPKYRGRAPVNWAIVHGESKTGATLHVMTERADAGDIVDQEAVPIDEDDTALAVQRRVSAAAVRILERSLAALEAGTARRRKQDESQATTFPRRRPEDGKIDWNRSAREVHDLVRAVTHPYPGAFTYVFGSGKTFVWKTRLPNLGAHDNFPGQVRREEGKLYVACGDDRYVEILSLQREGGDVDQARDFVLDLRDTR